LTSPSELASPIKASILTKPVTNLMGVGTGGHLHDRAMQLASFVESWDPQRPERPLLTHRWPISYRPRPFDEHRFSRTSSWSSCQSTTVMKTPAYLDVSRGDLALEPSGLTSLWSSRKVVIVLNVKTGRSDSPLMAEQRSAAYCPSKKMCDKQRGSAIRVATTRHGSINRETSTPRQPPSPQENDSDTVSTACLTIRFDLVLQSNESHSNEPKHSASWAFWTENGSALCVRNQRERKCRNGMLSLR
jgi:hypothetical protein